MGSHSQTDRSVVRTNFCVPLEPRAAGGGSSGTQKLIKQTFLMRVFCPHGPLRKYFRNVFSARTDLYENIFDAFFLPARTFTKIFFRSVVSARTAPQKTFCEAF